MWSACPDGRRGMTQDAPPSFVSTEHRSDNLAVHAGNEAQALIPPEVDRDGLTTVILFETHPFGLLP